jgi:hypothetical protein
MEPSQAEALLDEALPLVESASIREWVQSQIWIKILEPACKVRTLEPYLIRSRLHRSLCHRVAVQPTNTRRRSQWSTQPRS